MTTDSGITAPLTGIGRKALEEARRMEEGVAIGRGECTITLGCHIYPLTGLYGEQCSPQQQEDQDSMAFDGYDVVFEDDGVLEVVKDSDADTVVLFDGKPIEQIVREMTGLGVGSRQKVYFGFGYKVKPQAKADITPA